MEAHKPPTTTLQPTPKFLSEFVEYRDRTKQLLKSLNETAQHLFPQLPSGAYTMLEHEPAIYKALNEITKGLEDAVMEIAILTSRQAKAIEEHGCSSPDSFHFEAQQQEREE